MYTKQFVCMRCNKSFDIEKFTQENRGFSCPYCGGPLEIKYDYQRILANFIPAQFRYMPPTHMKYYFALPLKNPNKAVTLSEGGTPLISIGKNVFVKFEGVNPTGSFKDRGSSVEISKAVELGKRLVVCASTGNMGASIAAYSAKAGLHAIIFVPKFAERIKLKQMRYYGAKIVQGGSTYSSALLKSVEYAKRNNAYLTGDYPYRLEGQKTVGYEIADQLKLKSPDNIIIPVGNGTLFYATYKAFKEMKLLGIVKKVPKLIAVQAKGCAPIVNAYNKNAKTVRPIKNPKTIAGAINCDNPVEGEGVLRALRYSKGFAVAVSDNEMINAKKELARKGVYAEISSAAAYAAYAKLGEKIKGNTVMVITGIGFKDMY